MNKDKNTPDTDDQDLTRLFDAQQDRIPESLDALILTAARQAVAESEGPVHNRRGTVIKTWFAVAATLLLGITIAPLLLQAPESTLDHAAPKGSTLNAVAESVSMTTEPSVHELQDSESANASFSAADEAPMSINSPVMPAIRAQSRGRAESGAKVARQKRVSEGGEYRRSPESWLKQIGTLIEEKQPDMARAEYELFRKKYPNFAPDFAPDFTLDAEPE